MRPAQHILVRDADRAAVVTGAWLRDADSRYRMLVEQSPDAILVVCDGRYVYANPAALRLFGAKCPEELLGRDPVSLIHPDDRETAAERMRRAHDDRATVPLREFRVLRLDGTPVAIEGGPQPFNYQGRPAAHVVLRDITERDRAAAEIRENQERYRRLVELSPDAIFILERGRVAMINEAGLRLFGARTEADMIGRGVFELVHDDDHPLVNERLARLERGQPVPPIEQRYRRLDGTVMAVEVAAAPVSWRGEQVIQVVARDIGDRKEVETQLRRLGQMYAALSATNEAILRATSPEALYQGVCEIAIEHGGLRVAALRLLNADGSELVPVAVSGSTAESLANLAVPVAADAPGGKTAAAVAVRTGTTQVVNDITRRAPGAAWRRGALQAGAASTASIPVRRGGRIAGLLSLFAGEVGFFDDELVRLAERMAENVSFALDNFDRAAERERAEQRLRESEARFRSLTGLSSDWYWEQDEAFRFTFISAQQAGRTGPMPPVHIGKTRWELPALNLTDEDWARHRAQLARHEPFHDLEIRRPDRDGRPHWASVSGEPVFDAAGRFAGYRGVGRNITERKLAEARVARLGKLYAALSATNEAISRAASPGELHARVCEVAVAEGGFAAAAVVRVDADTAQVARVAASGPAAELVREIRLSIDESVPEGRGTIGEAFRSRAPVVANDYPADPRLAPWHAAAARYGIGSSAAIPLVRSDRAVGALVFLSVEKGAFDDELVTLLVRMADNLGFALDNFDREAERKRALEALRRFRLALDISDDSMVLVDAQTLAIVDLSDGARRKLGFGREELLGLSVLAILEGVDEAGLRAAYAGLRASPDRSEFVRLTYRCKDGSRLPVETARRCVESDGKHLIVAVARDISERLRAEEELRRSKERFEIVARATNDLVWDLNLTTGEVWRNENHALVYGRAAAGSARAFNDWAERIHPEDRERVLAQRSAALAGQATNMQYEYRARKADGTYAHMLDRAHIVRDGDGRAVRLIGAGMDFTDRKAAEGQLALHAERQEWIARFGQQALESTDLAALFAHAVQAARMTRAGAASVFEFDPQGGHAQRAAWHLEGDAGAGDALVACDHAVAHAARQQLEPTVLADRPATEGLATAGGWSKATRSSIAARIRGEHGPFGLLMVLARGESRFTDDEVKFIQTVGNILSTAVQRRQAETRLAQLAQYDGVTGLPNRNLLRDRLAQAISQAERRSWQVAALFIDLDRFKLVNDTLGHQCGDRLLAEVGMRLRSTVRGSDTVARFSGDEFVVVLPDLVRADDAAIVAQKLIAALAAPFQLNGREAFVGASIGIAFYPADCSDAESLLKAADAAMYRAKDSGRGGYCFYTTEMNRRSDARLVLEADLRRAVEREEFVLVYQPKVELATGRVCGAEALLRWRHPERGMVSPTDFIPVLEDTGLIVPVGEWVVRAACRQLRAWQDARLKPVPVAVNVSARQFHTRDLDRRIIELVEREGVDPQLLEVELTESYLVQDPEHAIGLLRRLREAGVAISIDDFGTGYSSLAYLTRFPVSALKVDRQFVRGATAAGSDAAIVRAVIDMAHNLGFVVVAEGVETEAQVEFLRHHRCDQAQGFHFARPMPPDELAKLLRAAAADTVI
ncbi:MAG TPA: PAS domain S-box protein [Burkholderiales bacterium]|nr:PAS domain S-box protein [Burkholderiales bacterium]